MKKRIAVLGSTGSIGTQALEVIDKNPESFELMAITAGNNADLLIEQALRFVPRHVVIGNESKYAYVRDALAHLPVNVAAGFDTIVKAAGLEEIDMVLTAMVGYSGLLPTVEAVKSGKDIALANKETLVVAGEYIKKIAAENHVQILPVDSEHSAIFQCLVGEPAKSIEKIYLTASGGPFRGKTREALEHVTKKEALQHPNWCMGNKVTIDSASLMNKGLEVIEARWLFDLPPDQIDVIIHPQSIIHSMVQFTDGSLKAQMGLPDMRLPIQYALGFPDRLKSDFPRFNFADYPSLTFQKPDTSVFRNLELAFEALRKGGNMPCILNAANEIVVNAFLNDKVKFLQMPSIIEKVMHKISFIPNPSLDDYCASDSESRTITRELITAKTVF
ncbi:MAG: 1-deoxy-D-xylulose-5-phosphate reductoisomerase [Bacteroidales bacterium]|nr:1-deoxy-D-xylulose-5-phosphate reductoisomerase [Bacteroidales bacterium]